MRISRRNLLSGTAGLTASSAMPLLPAAAADARLPFVLIGDWGRYGIDFQRNVADQMGKTAAEINSQFTVSMGDNFYENGVTGLSDPYWRLSFENIYTAPSLQSPWKIILGNHDYRGNVQAQLDYSNLSHRWRLPARYYSERVSLPDGGDAEFFYLDTSPFISAYKGTAVDIRGQDTGAQAAWLDNALGKSTARWKIVIGHHPIYTPFKEQDKDQADMIARIDPILRAHNVPIYICGHYHLLQATTVRGVTYVVNGAGSETYSTNAATREGFTSSNHGFMTIQLSRAKLDYALVDMSGKTLFAQTVTPG